jgi:hypothetical protein
VQKEVKQTHMISRNSNLGAFFAEYRNLRYSANNRALRGFRHGKNKNPCFAKIFIFAATA